MNAEALEKTQATGLAHFFSRSRGSLWFKGESSGETFAVNEIRVDCDQDVLQLRVTAQGKGNACHTGRRSCFYRKLENGKLAFIKS
jgi:phosphoribosyl-AMP cyclohydrolase